MVGFVAFFVGVIVTLIFSGYERDVWTTHFQRAVWTTFISMPEELVSYIYGELCLLNMERFFIRFNY